jgi:hypothetical protein
MAASARLPPRARAAGPAPRARLALTLGARPEGGFDAWVTLPDGTRHHFDDPFALVRFLAAAAAAPPRPGGRGLR